VLIRQAGQMCASTGHRGYRSANGGAAMLSAGCGEAVPRPPTGTQVYQGRPFLREALGA
jgi:hypothetical protein